MPLKRYTLGSPLLRRAGGGEALGKSNLPGTVRENTVIIFIGDNGTPREVVQSPYEPGKAKGTLYEGGIHIPMIVSGAGVTRAGERESALLNSTDIFSTISDLAGTEFPAINDSRSFRALLSDAAASKRTEIYSEVSSANVWGWAIRNERFKLIQYDDGSEEFFDLSTDPYEQNDLLTGTLDSIQQNEKTDLEQKGADIRQ